MQITQPTAIQKRNKAIIPNFLLPCFTIISWAVSYWSSSSTFPSCYSQVCEQQQCQVCGRVPAWNLCKYWEDHQGLPQLCHGPSGSAVDDWLTLRAQVPVSIKFIPGWFKILWGTKKFNKSHKDLFKVSTSDLWRLIYMRLEWAFIGKTYLVVSLFHHSGPPLASHALLMLQQ